MSLYTRAQFYVLQQRIDKTENLPGYAAIFTVKGWAGFFDPDLVEGRYRYLVPGIDISLLYDASDFS